VTLSAGIDLSGAAGELRGSAAIDKRGGHVTQRVLTNGVVSYQRESPLLAESVYPGDGVADGVGIARALSDLQADALFEPASGDVILTGSLSASIYALSDGRCTEDCIVPSARADSDVSFYQEFWLRTPHYYSLYAVVDAASDAQSQTYADTGFEIRSVPQGSRIAYDATAGLPAARTTIQSGQLMPGSYLLVSFALGSTLDRVLAEPGEVLARSASASVRYQLNLNPDAPPAVVPLPGAFGLLISAIFMASVGQVRRPCRTDKFAG
jgi:hypothetical protein